MARFQGLGSAAQARSDARACALPGVGSLLLLASAAGRESSPETRKPSLVSGEDSRPPASELLPLPTLVFARAGPRPGRKENRREGVSPCRCAGRGTRRCGRWPLRSRRVDLYLVHQPLQRLAETGTSISRSRPWAPPSSQGADAEVEGAVGVEDLHADVAARDVLGGVRGDRVADQHGVGEAVEREVGARGEDRRHAARDGARPAVRAGSACPPRGGPRRGGRRGARARR